MERDYKLYIKDIIECIDIISEYKGDILEENFKKDRKLQDAIIRRLQIIGEASTKIPRFIKQNNSEIPWETMQNLRNVIIHTYFEASINRIWKVITEDLVSLKENLLKLKYF
jgi:uncharacterized protein with HEPN domain